ncbi:MAG TPA: Hsp20/alpha crystallin family protein [Thermoplasmata archaeon]|nr:Hsp20/alpha crystallin family protein [Thermoplasmata archaeon]
MTKELQTKESNPWADLDQVVDDLGRRFYETFGIAPFGAVRVSDAGPQYLRAARTDVTDTGAAFRIVAEVPGIPKDQIEVRVRGANVEIRGESTQETKESKAEYVHRERTYAGYYRSLELPEPVVGGEAKATVENGLLTLELPKLTPTPVETDVKVPVQ